MECCGCVANHPADIQLVLGPWIRADGVLVNTALVHEITKPTNQASTRATSASK